MRKQCVLVKFGKNLPEQEIIKKCTLRCDKNIRGGMCESSCKARHHEEGYTAFKHMINVAFVSIERYYKTFLIQEVFLHKWINT